MRHPRWLVATNLGLAILLAAFAVLHAGAGERWRSIAVHGASYGAIYGASAVTTVLALHARRGWIAAGVVGVATAVWGGLLWTDLVGHAGFASRWRHLSAATARHELREAIGLTIACTWLSMSSMIGWQRSRALRQ